MLAYADDVILMADNTSDLQSGINCLNAACEEFGMKISVGKTKVMHVGKSRKEVACNLNGEQLEQVSEFKYLGTIFSEDGKLGNLRKGGKWAMLWPVSCGHTCSTRRDSVVALSWLFTAQSTGRLFYMVVKVG